MHALDYEESGLKLLLMGDRENAELEKYFFFLRGSRNEAFRAYDCKKAQRSQICLH